MPPKKTITVEAMCESLIACNYYHEIQSTSNNECLKLVTLNLFNIASEKKIMKKRLLALMARVRLFLVGYEKEINEYFTTYFNGPNKNFPKTFKIEFAYLDIFNTGNTFNNNLRNNVYDEFQKINSLCILSELSKHINNNKYPLVVIQFKCCFKNCPATYKFKLETSAIDKNKRLTF